MKVKLHEERTFTIRHTLWYSIIYFALVQALIPLLMSAVAFLLGDAYITTAGEVEIPIYYNFLVYAIGLFLFYIISIGVLRTQWELFKHKLLEHIKIVLMLFGIMIVLVMVSNYMISEFLGTETSSNQSSINAIFKYAPTFVLFVTLVFAPICEELVFRGGFYFGFIRAGMSETKAMMISSLGFGLLHVAPTLFQGGQFVLSEAFYIIPYAVMGLFFTEAARRTNNIWGSISLHFLNNLISILVLFLL